MLDWVFADGPPGNARNYDNNARQDFHAILLNNMTEEEYWVEEEQLIYTRLQQDRREREETSKRKVRCNRTFMLVLFGLVCVPAILLVICRSWTNPISKIMVQLHQ